MLTVTSASLAITTATLANGVVGSPYTGTIQATGGVAPFVWTVSSGTLPHNLSLNVSTTSSDTVSGLPDAVAQGMAFTIEVTDSAHHIATQAYTVSILPKADSLVPSPARMDFGDETVSSTSGALTETLTNNATTPVAITSIAISGLNAAEFSQITTCAASLAAAASCAISVTFTPAQSGSRSAALTIINTPQEVLTHCR